jgi:Fe-S-cluster-containing dehydrogenase component/formate-dependent nitrite reductase membrane component NrfD
MNYGFIIDNRKCIGCHACTVACKSEHQVPIGVNRTWVKYIEKGEYPTASRTFTVLRCNHCADAPCVDICPVTALFAREDGIVDFDYERCIGCKACTQACPYDALYIDPETHTAAKCNYCAHRVHRGLEPACVIVCPEHAIISGDLDDTCSEISTLLAAERVQVRKPEKGTQPKLFYIEGDEAALSPIAAEPFDDYMWSSQAHGVGHNVGEPVNGDGQPGKAGKKIDLRALVGMPASKPSWWNLLVSPEKARRVYDAPRKGILWGWEVPAYLWTKSISAGAALMAFSLSIFGAGSVQIEWAGAVLGLFFLAMTGVLLILDLDRPDRFLYVLFRPHWQSWLVRGAYIITGFGGLLTLWMISRLAGWDGVAKATTLLSIPFAIMSAVYTALLFAQAKGRDHWQNPMLSVNMFLHSIMTGASALLLVLAVAGWSEEAAMKTLATILLWSVVAHLVLMMLEMLTRHPTKDSQLAAEMIVKGKFRSLFWLGVIFVGNIVPILLLSISPLSIVASLAVVCVLVGVALSNHLLVRVPQLIPLS